MEGSIVGEISFIANRIQASIDTKAAIAHDDALLGAIQTASSAIVDRLGAGGRVFFAGNGGSAADAQHLAAELVGRFYLERKGLSAEALSTNTSIITAIANDYSFESIFARQIEAGARPRDVFVGLSTSGNSQDIVLATRACKVKGVYAIALTGRGGGALRGIADILIDVPSTDTPRIQEAHILIGHIMCEIVERELFGVAANE
jgi:D-sedoheptulose 7-phosphate isomerase